MNHITMGMLYMELKMGKKNETQNGKGDKSRISNKKKYDENWDKIFKKSNKNGKGIQQ